MNVDKNKRERQQSLRQLIDCCRPGSDDALQPEMTELEQGLASDVELREYYERSQRFDASVAAAFHDVPVPEGLAERLVGAVSRRAADSECQAASHHQELEEHPVLPATLHQERSGGGSRRHRFRWVAAAITAAGVVLLIGMASYAVWFLRPTLVPTQDVIDRALQWTTNAKEHPWNSDLTEAPLKDYPREPSLRAAPLGWQILSSPNHPDVASYDLTPPGKSFVAQFTTPVSPSMQFELPRSLPSHPTSSTGGFCIGACVRDGYLYVLVVEGDAARYRQFVQPEPPVT